MPIGFSRESGSTPVRPATEERRPTWAERVVALAQTAITAATGVESTNRTLAPTLWTRWQTSFDERVCPHCAPYAGRVWRIDDGPQPPLHPNCRCQRRYAFTTWSVRETP